MKRIWLFLPLVLAIALGFILYLGLGKDPSKLESARTGEPVPDFELALLDQPGTQVGPEVFEGRTRLLNVWATWCPACRDEHPYLMTLAEKGIPIVGLNYKDQREPAQEWLRSLGDPYSLVLFDPKGTLGFDLGVYGAPETYVIDAEGNVRHRFVGIVNEKVWEQELGPVYRRFSEQEG